MSARFTGIVMDEKTNYTYLLRCSDGTLYCGWTNDLEKRLAAHNAGKGGKYTRARRPVTLVWREAFDTKQEAMSREFRLKRVPRSEKLRLIEQDGVRTDSLYEGGQDQCKKQSG